MKKILHIVGARPNFVKIAPLMREMSKYPDDFSQVLVHTGQHYDYEMCKVFFKDLNMPEPTLDLHVQSGTHVYHLVEIMRKLEDVFAQIKPDLVVVPGDTNSALAGALAANKCGYKVAHIEAGLRSFDKSMPEEVNRIIVDQVSDFHFAPTVDACNNLKTEGFSKESIHFVGNVMIDSLVDNLPAIDAHWGELKKSLNINRSYVLVTLHREYMSKNLDVLHRTLGQIANIADTLPVLFPVHPRMQTDVRDALVQSKVHMLGPLGYLDFVSLEKNALCVITDSGGAQEETAYFGVPCLTVRKNTERMVTILSGSNRLVDPEKDDLYEIFCDTRFETVKRGITYWDGHTAERIVNVLRKV